MNQRLSLNKFGKTYGESQGQNRTRENRPSGIERGLWETLAMGELGTHTIIERVDMETLCLKCCAPSSTRHRKSQRRAYTWANFKQALAGVEWPQPRLRKDLNPCRRAEAH